MFFNTSSIFASVGVKNSDDAALMVMGPQIIVSIVTCLLMDSAGRRPLLVRIGAAPRAVTHRNDVSERAVSWACERSH